MRTIFTIALLLYFLFPKVVFAQTIIFDPNSPTPYEACPGSTIEIAYVGASSTVNSISIPTKNGPITQDNASATGAVVPSFTQIGYAGGTFTTGLCTTCPPCPTVAPNRCGIMIITLPADAISGPIKLYSAISGGGTQIATVPMIIPNPVVNFGSIPVPVCSENEIPLIGTPSGGTFELQQLPSGNAIPSASYIDYAPTGPYAAYDAVFYPNSTPAAGGYSGTPGVITGAGLYSRDIQMRYLAPNSLSNGTACPAVAGAWFQFTVYQNPPLTVTYNQASATTPTPISSLVGLPNGSFTPSVVWNEVPANVTASYYGTYVSGTNFLGNAAGNGVHQMTTELNNNGCISTGTGDVVVGTPPTPTFPSEICATGTTTSFTISRADFTSSGTFSFPGCDYFRFVATCSPYPGAITTVSSTLGAEQFLFNPIAAGVPVGTTITITMRLVIDCGGAQTPISFPTAPRTHTVDIVGPGGVARPGVLITDFCESSTPIDLINSTNGFTVSPTLIEIIPLTGPLAGTVILSLTGPSFTFTPTSIHTDPFDTEYMLTFEGSGGSCITKDTFTFFVRETITPDFVGRHSGGPLVDEYCENEAIDLLSPFPLPTSGLSGIFSVNGVPIVGTAFDPSLYTNSSHVVTYNFVSIYNCPSSVSKTFTINALPPVQLTGTGFATGTFTAPAYCANQNNATLLGSPSGGGFTGIYNGPTLTAPTDNTFDPNAIHSAQGIDSIPAFAFFTYTVTENATGCSNIDTMLVTINPFSRPTVFGFPADRQYCDGEILSPVTISAVDTFNPGGYLFTGNGVLQNPNFYHPDTAGIGVDPVILTFTNLYNCQTIDTIHITIDTIPIPSITNLPAIMCIDDPAFLLAGNPAVGTGIASTFTGIGVVNGLTLLPPQPAGDYFYPNNAGTGLKEITYTYTDANTCTGVIKDTVNVRQLPQARFFGLNPSYCVTSPADTLYPFETVGNSVFSGAGITQPFGELTPSTAGLPGIKTIIYTYTDTFGCIGVDSQLYFLNPLPIVGIVGIDSAYCANGANDFIQGLPAGTGGTFTPIPGLAQLGFGQASFNPAFSPLSPTFVNIKYKYTDGNGCTDSITLQTEVFPPPAPSITGLNPQYCETQDTFLITGLPAGGYFSGPGTAIGQNTFMPFRAGSGAHTVTYTVTDTFVPTFAPTSILVCTSVASQPVTVSPLPVPSIVSPINNATFCENDPMSRIYGTIQNISTLADSVCQGVGVFDSIVLSPLFIPGIGTVLIPDTIHFFNPALAGPGIHAVTYTATNTFGCVDSVSHSYTVYAIPQPDFLIDSVFCESDPPVFLSGTPAGGIFTLNGAVMTTNVYYPNPNYPTVLLPSQKRDTLVYTANNAQCVARDTNYVLVNPNPIVTYQGFLNGTISDKACLGTDTIALVPNILGGTFSGSGVLFATSNFIANISGVGAHKVSYNYMDVTTGCSDAFVDTFYVYSTPNVNFVVEGGCGDTSIIFVPDNGVLGLNGNFLGNLFDSITLVQWTFGDGLVLNDLPIGNQNQVDTVHHLYANAGVYTTVLYVENQGFCTGSDTVRVIVSPAETPTALLPYTEDFEITNGGWYEEAESGNASSNLWSWGMTPGPRIRTNNDPEHLKVWTTNILQRPYPQNAAGWVYSPCIDLTELDRPMLKLDYYNDTDPGNDGVVVEYYDKNLQEWKPLGNVDRGLNWYNDAVIAGRPGLQDLAPKGWSGLSNGWKDGRYKLDDFKSYEDFRFRVAFGAVGVSGTYEGFAFDNVWVGNRTRNVLLEHFSNAGVTNFDAMNNHVYDLVYGTSLVYDVVLAQFNTEGPSTDIFNQSNSADVSGRVFNYGGFEQSGKAAIDGKRFSATSASTALQEVNFEHDMLESPKFDIQLNNVQIFAGTVQATALVTANEDMPLETYYVQMLVLEDSMTYFSGERVHSVMRKMMPNAAGTDFQRAWVTGDQGTATESWSFNTSQLNAQNMNVLAFIEIDGSDEREIYQVVSTRDITAYADALGTPEAEAAVAASQEILNMNLYPNPTTSQITIEFDAPLSKDFNWEIYDLLGRRLQGGIANEGTQKMNVEGLDNWAEGAYLFIVRDPKFTVQKKFVVRR